MSPPVGEPVWRAWRHVTKIDPGRPWDKGLLETVARSGTDAVVIGGTEHVEAGAVSRLLSELSPDPAIPVAVEVSCPSCLIPGADLYLVPVVLNSQDREWLVGAHHRAMMTVGALAELVPPVPEFYVVLNPDSAVARRTSALCPLTPGEVEAYVRTARLLMGAGIVYLEGSGRFMDEELLKAAAEAGGTSRLFYGGGIGSAAQAETAGRWVDTIVVGNLIYERPDLLGETVRAVKT